MSKMSIIIYREMNDYRRDAAAAVVNGKIFCSSSNSVECYDPSSDIWTRACNILQEIWEHGAVEMNDSFIVMGGFSVNYLENVWALDTTDTNAEWIEKPSMSIPRSGFSIAKVDDKIFVCGGETEKEDKLETSDLVEIFDGEIWRNGPKVPTPRKNAPTVVIPKKFARYLN